MQIILKRSILLCTKKAHAETSGGYPLVLHGQLEIDSEIAGRAKPRPNRLGSVKAYCKTSPSA